MSLIDDQLSISGGNSISLNSLLPFSSATSSTSLYWKTVGLDQVALGIQDGNEIALQTLAPLHVSNSSSSSVILSVTPSTQ